MENNTEKRNQPTIHISEEEGFTPLPTESISSRVFVKDGKIYKINSRDSIERQVASLQALNDRMGQYKDHIVPSEVAECMFEGKTYTCVVQNVVDGKELKNLDQERLIEVLRLNKEFLLELLQYFFDAIENNELYPDIVGYPKDPEYFNSINLLAEDISKKVLLCDIGLSPHEDTLAKFGLEFYQSENVQTYVAKMKKFQEFLQTL